MTLPKKSTIYPNAQRDADERGGILSIVDAPLKNVSIITKFWKIMKIVDF